MSHSTVHGGAVLWLEMLRRTGTGVLRKLPWRVAGWQGWSDGQMLRAVLLLDVVGYERVSDMGELEKDRSRCRLVRDYEAELLGLPTASLAARLRGGRVRAFPPANAVHEWLARFHDEAVGAERVKGVAVVSEAAAELQLMEEVDRRLIELQVRRHWLPRVAKVVRCARTRHIVFMVAHAQRMHRTLGRMARSQAYDIS